MLGHEHLAVARAALGADPQADLDSGLAAAVLRQAVHQRGSVPRARLLAEAAMLLAPLVSDAVDVGDILERDLEALLAVGELVLRQPTPGAHVHVDPARPTFVQVRLDGDEPFLIAGGSVDGRPVLRLLGARRMSTKVEVDEEPSGHVLEVDAGAELVRVPRS